LTWNNPATELGAAPAYCTSAGLPSTHACT
jgi:hypothetical protein